LSRHPNYNKYECQECGHVEMIDHDDVGPLDCPYCEPDEVFPEDEFEAEEEFGDDEYE
jgi:rubrerythrin